MLRGKRAVITGGGTGFGQALSVWLAREERRGGFLREAR